MWILYFHWLGLLGWVILVVAMFMYMSPWYHMTISRSLIGQRSSPPPSGPETPPPKRIYSWLDLWIVPAWSPKNKEVFRIGFVDCPRVEPLKREGIPDFTHGLSPHVAFKTRRWSGSDLWIVPAFCSRSTLCRALKTRRCSKLDNMFFFSFLTQCYYTHTSRESVSHVCGYFWNILWDNVTFMNMVYEQVIPLLTLVILWAQAHQPRQKIFRGSSTKGFGLICRFFLQAF